MSVPTTVSEQVHLIGTFIDTIDALPREMSRHLSDFSEVDAGVYEEKDELAKRVLELEQSIKDPGATNSERLTMLRSIVDLSRHFREKNEDRLKAIKEMDQTVNEFNLHLSSLSTLLLPYLPRSMLEKLYSSTSPHGLPSDIPLSILAQRHGFDLEQLKKGNRQGIITHPPIDGRIQSVLANDPGNSTRMKAALSTAKSHWDYTRGGDRPLEALTNYPEWGYPKQFERSVIPTQPQVQRNPYYNGSSKVNMGRTIHDLDLKKRKLDDVTTSTKRRKKDSDDVDGSYQPVLKSISRSPVVTNPSTNGRKLENIIHYTPDPVEVKQPPSTPKPKQRAQKPQYREPEDDEDEVEDAPKFKPPRKRKSVEDSDGDAEAEENEADALYCICERPSFGKMIACDENNCKREWFHLPCVGLESIPQGEWYCDACKSKRK